MSHIPYGDHFGWSSQHNTLGNYLDQLNGSEEEVVEEEEVVDEERKQGKKTTTVTAEQEASAADGPAMSAAVDVGVDGSQQQHAHVTPERPVTGANLPPTLPPSYVFHPMPVDELRRAGAGSVYSEDLAKFRFPFMNQHITCSSAMGSKSSSVGTAPVRPFIGTRTPSTPSSTEERCGS